MFLLDGRKAQKVIAECLRERIQKMAPETIRQPFSAGWGSGAPTLAIIQIGSREESTAYIRRKKIFAASIGAAVRHLCVDEAAGEEEIRAAIEGQNADAAVHGVILQLPIPERLNRQSLLDAILPEKDADGLTSEQTARRARREEGAIVPATARGILEILRHYRVPVAGRKAAVLGRSQLVGAPTAEALRRAGAEVTVCHSKTPDTRDITRASDIVVVAIGKPRLIGREYFRSDRTQAVVDVGINTVAGAAFLEEVPRRNIVGDVDFEAVKDIVSAISPVPGGVGPMTVAALFENLIEARERLCDP